MKRYHVVLNETHRAKPEQVVDGCLGEQNHKLTYTRGEALKKARMFDGAIKETVSYVVDTLKVAQITRNSLVWGLEKALKGREVYASTKDSPEVMYYGNVFDDLIEENREGKITLDVKAYNQCRDIAQEVTEYQYIHIIEG